MEANFQGELLPEERVLWTGRPGQSVFSPADWFLVPFSLVWGGFAIFWEATVLGVHTHGGHRPPAFFAVFGAFFVALGLYFMVGRFFYKAWCNKRTFYAVTNKRVIVVTEAGTRKTRAAFIHQIPVTNKRIRADGSGTLSFGTSNGLGGVASVYDNTGLDFLGAFYGTLPPTFHSIPDADRVYRIVAEQQRGASS